MSTEERSFGRIEIYDQRDENYLAAPFLNQLPNLQLSSRYWYADGWAGDQRNTPECTAYSWLGFLHDGPVVQESFVQKPMYDTTQLYKKFQENDGIQGVYQGSTVRAGAKVLKKLGFLKEYRWARDVNEVVKALLVLGPVVVGSKWYSDMMHPDSYGRITVSGASNGGHAYLLNGVDTTKNLFRIKNSWGNRWGIQGHGFIDINDFEKLMKDGGDVCIALESSLSYIPDLNTILNEDVPA